MAANGLNLAVNQGNVALNNRLLGLLGFINAPTLLVLSLYVDIAKKLKSVK